MDKTILVVDDDMKLRDLLREYLEEYGYRVLALPDGSGAVEMIRSKSPDMVILDIMLPGKDGLEVLKDIRNESQVPVIMLTARGEDADRAFRRAREIDREAASINRISGCQDGR